VSRRGGGTPRLLVTSWNEERDGLEYRTGVTKTLFARNACLSSTTYPHIVPVIVRDVDIYNAGRDLRLNRHTSRFHSEGDVVWSSRFGLALITARNRLLHQREPSPECIHPSYGSRRKGQMTPGLVSSISQLPVTVPSTLFSTTPAL
jgi:hypothetical protein